MFAASLRRLKLLRLNDGYCRRGVLSSVALAVAAAAAAGNAGPAELQAAFSFAYEAAGRSPAGTSSTVSSNPFSLFSRLLGGGRGGSSTAAAASAGSSSGGGSGSSSSSGFPEDDVKVLKGLNDLLLRFKVVYDDAEQRAGLKQETGA
jgi:hypothetical protein